MPVFIKQHGLKEKFSKVVYIQGPRQTIGEEQIQISSKKFLGEKEVN